MSLLPWRAKWEDARARKGGFLAGGEGGEEEDEGEEEEVEVEEEEAPLTAWLDESAPAAPLPPPPWSALILATAASSSLESAARRASSGEEGEEDIRARVTVPALRFDRTFQCSDARDLDVKKNQELHCSSGEHRVRRERRLFLLALSHYLYPEVGNARL